MNMQNDGTTNTHEKSHRYNGITHAAIECARMCEHCCKMCVEEGHPECIKETGDCAQLCWNFASLLERESDFVPSFARVVEEACEACADECSSYEGSAHHQKCAEACRKLAEHCRSFEQASMPKSA